MPARRYARLPGVGGPVFLLGAGFSNAIGPDMPLMAGLGTAVQETLGAGALPPPVGRFGDDFEAWLSYLATDQPWLSAAENLRNRAAFLDVAQAVEEVLSAAQQRATEGRSLPPELDRLLRHWIDTTATVVTFNYDLLVESAYLNVELGGGVEDLYRLPITLAAARTRPGKAVLGASPREPQVRFDLLKLHGSLNWFYSGLGDSAADTIYLGSTPGLWSVPVSPGSIDRDEVVFGNPRERDYLVDKVPLIIPPAAAKGSYYSNLSLRRQWQVAAAALDAADELVVVGYSLPRTDELVRGLLRTISARLERIVVVDKDPGAVVERLREVYGPAVNIQGRFSGDNALDNYATELD